MLSTASTRAQRVILRNPGAASRARECRQDALPSRRPWASQRSDSGIPRRTRATSRAGSPETMKVARQPNAGANTLPIRAASPTPNGAPDCIKAP